MFVDASAVIAIMLREHEFERLALVLADAGSAQSSPIAVYESVVGIARSKTIAVEEAERQVELFLRDARVVVAPITAEIGRLAHDAFRRFGKGRHPASLNMGNCFAYACAQQLGAPLLFKGNDFARTDIRSAMDV